LDPLAIYIGEWRINVQQIPVSSKKTGGCTAADTTRSG